MMMMLKKIPRKEALFEAVLKREAERKRAVTRLSNDLQRMYDSYFLRVTRFLKSRNFASKTEILNLAASTRALNELTQILSDAGYEDVLANFHDEFESLTRSATKYFTQFGVKDDLAGIDLESLQVYADARKLNLGDTVSRTLIEPIQSAILQANMGNQTRESIIDMVLQKSENLTPWQAETLVDDSFSQYQRAVTVQKADNLDMEIFQYLGPEDGITSDQCEFMLNVDFHGVPGMLYRDEITQKLHPDLTGDPLTCGGHPRCRHQWSPVTVDYAVSLGFEPRQGTVAA